MNEPIILNKRYQLEESLGSGGMAVVYRARDLELERPVAVKILREDYSNDPDFRERFRQEARAAANLSHPNLVTVHDFGLDRGRLFIVLEHVPGTDLKTTLQRRGRLGVEEAVDLMTQACAGVGYAHRAGLVHCDLKPHNLLITPDRRLKVTDFGIARALASIKPEEHSEIVWGSPLYFAPEQAAGGPPSPASDVYSLGVVLFEMLTGQPPFNAPTAAELSRLHRSVPPPAPRQLNPAISAGLEHIILKVLSKEPTARFRTADQLGRVLNSLSQPQPAALPPQPAAQVLQTSIPASVDVHSASPAIPRGDTRPAISPLSEPSEANAERDPMDIDWTTTLLGLVALLALGGLVPLYLWLYFLYR